MKTPLVGLILVVLSGCSGPKKDWKQEIVDTDLAFSALSREKGMQLAFIEYAAEDVIKPQPNNQPIVGKQALIKSFEGKPQDFELTWEPIKAEASETIGYTFGNYQLKTKTVNSRDTVLFGNYVSIWKKQNDGKWKYVFDTGNPTPAPTKVE